MMRVFLVAATTLGLMGFTQPPGADPSSMSDGEPPKHAAPETAESAPPPRKVEPADWTPPSNADITRRFPEAARKAGIGGKATVHCTVSLQGVARDCRVTAESPAGHGFGRAALEVIEPLRMKPARVDGRPVDGGGIQMTIGFTAASPASASPTAKGGPVFTAPRWSKQPTGEEIAALYPARAQRQGVEGRAVVTCRVRLDHRLHDCAVLEENPTGMGFGQAALELAKKGRMSPGAVDGRPINDAPVRIPVNFALPDAAPGPRPKAKPANQPVAEPLKLPGTTDIGLFAGGALGAALLLASLTWLWLGRLRDYA